MRSINFDIDTEKWKMIPAGEASRQEFMEIANAMGPAVTCHAFAKTFWADPESFANRLLLNYHPEHKPFTIKRIAFYYFRMYNGGIERVISKLLPVFQELGYEVYLITDEAPNKKDYPYPDTVTRIVLPKEAHYDKGTDPTHFSKRALAFEKIIKEYNIDTIFYHAWYSKYLLWESLLFKALHVKFIVEAHNIFTMAMYDWPAEAGWRPSVFRFADAMVTLSRVDALYWSDYTRSYYVPNPIALTPKDEVSPLAGKQILWAGRLSEQKDPVAAVNIMRLLHEEVPDAELNIVGEEDAGTGFESAVRRTIAQFGAEDYVHMLGYQSDMVSLYKKSSVLLMTSKYEGFPMVLAECKNYGLPIVMYDLPFLEFVRDSRGLFAVPQKDEQGAAEALAKLLSNEETLRKSGKLSRESAESFFLQCGKERWQEVLWKIQNSEPEGNTLSEDAHIMKDVLQSYIPIMMGKYGEQKKDLRGWLNGIYYAPEDENTPFMKHLAIKLRRGFTKFAYGIADIFFPVHSRRREKLKDFMRKRIS